MIAYEDLNRLNAPFAAELRAAFAEALNEGTFILGRQVREFENEFATYCGAAHCVGVGNGLDALTLALRCFEFKAGSEVIVPSNTHIASILAIINSGLMPVFVEPDISTYNIDPDLLEDSITPRTVAIMVVHLYGKCCSMDEVLAIREKHNLRLIEDCAHAHGAKYKGRMAGTFGDFGAFSFYPTKNFGALGDAGCVVSNQEKLSAMVRSLRNYGANSRDHFDSIGINSRLDELQAAFLRIKLKHLDEMNERRRTLANVYQIVLSDQFIKPIRHPDYFDVYHVYNVRHPKRDLLKSFLTKIGVETSIHYPIPPYNQNSLRHFFHDEFPISDEIHATTLSLPISPIHSVEEVTQIAEAMNHFLAHTK